VFYFVIVGKLNSGSCIDIITLKLFLKTAVFVDCVR
jgi:hypothetical protein